MVRYASGPFAPFPLTLTLSLREREQRAPRRESRKTWIVLRREKGSPSPQGRGLGSGERDHRTAQREYPRLFMRPMSAGLYPDFVDDESGFIISCLGLCRNLVAALCSPCEGLASRSNPPATRAAPPRTPAVGRGTGDDAPRAPRSSARGRRAARLCNPGFLAGTTRCARHKSPRRDRTAERSRPRVGHNRALQRCED